MKYFKRERGGERANVLKTRENADFMQKRYRKPATEAKLMSIS
jgi:hypothetical protein